MDATTENNESSSSDSDAGAAPSAPQDAAVAAPQDAAAAARRARQREKKRRQRQQRREAAAAAAAAASAGAPAPPPAAAPGAELKAGLMHEAAGRLAEALQCYAGGSSLGAGDGGGGQALACAQQLARLAEGGAGAAVAPLAAALEAGLCSGPFLHYLRELARCPFHMLLAKEPRSFSAVLLPGALRSYLVGFVFAMGREAEDAEVAIAHFEDCARAASGRCLAAAALRTAAFCAMQRPASHRHACALAGRAAAAALALAEPASAAAPHWRQWAGHLSLLQAYAYYLAASARHPGAEVMDALLDWRGCMQPALERACAHLAGSGSEGSFTAMAAMMSRGLLLGCFPGVRPNAVEGLAYARLAMPTAPPSPSQIDAWLPRYATAVGSLLVLLEKLHDKMQAQGRAGYYPVVASLLLTLQRGCSHLAAAIPRGKKHVEVLCHVLQTLHRTCELGVTLSKPVHDFSQQLAREAEAGGAAPPAGAAAADAGAAAPQTGAGEGAGEAPRAAGADELPLQPRAGPDPPEELLQLLIEVAAAPEFTPQGQRALLLENLARRGEVRGPGSGCAACMLAIFYRDGEDSLRVLPDAALAQRWRERALALGHSVPAPGEGGHEAAHGAVLDPEHEVYAPLEGAMGGGGGGGCG